jgi:hypothetical protein
MKKRILFTLLIFTAALGWSQSSPVTAQLTASASTCSPPTNAAYTSACLFLPVGASTNTVGASIGSSTFSATVQFEATVDNVTWSSVSATNASGTATSATASGSWQIQAGGYQFVRMRVSTYASGTVTATLNPSKAVTAGSSSSGGSGGNVTPSAGPLSGMPINCSAGTNCLLAYYAMMDGTGTVVHDSGPNANNAAFGTGTPTWVTSGGLKNGGNSNVAIPAAVTQAAKTVIIAFTHTAFASSGQAAFLQGAANVAGCTGLIIHGNWPPNGNYDGLQGNTQGAFAGITDLPIIGTHVLIWEPSGASNGADSSWIDGNPSDVNYSNEGGFGATPVATASFWNLFGTGTPNCTNSVGFMPAADTIYAAAFYNQYLTNGEVTAVTTFLENVLQGRGDWPPFANLGQSAASQQVGAFGTTGDILSLDGDSEMNSLAIPNSSIFLNDAGATIYNDGVNGQVVEERMVAAPAEVEQFTPISGRCLLINWSGTNNYAFTADTATQTGQLLLKYAADRKRRTGCSVMLATMLDRSGTGGSTYAENLSTFLRQNWANGGVAGIVDFQSNANLGASGANSNTVYFTDGLHTTTAAKRNILDFFIQRNVNRFWGNNDFSNATTYLTGAAAATAITSCSESTNTVTCNTTLNPGAGVCATLLSISVSGYNTNYPTTPPCWMILTSTSSQITYYNTVSGLGAATGGTISVPLQKDADGAVILAGTATSPSFTLETCQGLPVSTLQPWIVQLKNENTTSPWVITPTNGETIDGASSLTMPAATTNIFPVVNLAVVNSGASTGNCTYTKIQTN